MKEIKSQKLISALKALFNCAFDFEDALYQCTTSSDVEFVYGPTSEFGMFELIQYGKKWFKAYKNGKNIWYLELPVEGQWPSYIFFTATKKQLPKLINKIMKKSQEYILENA